MIKLRSGQAASGDSIESIFLVRALASIGVCVRFIFVKHPFIQESALSVFFYYAYLGVPMFFVVTGTVIPLALERHAYRVTHFFNYVFRRMARLDPPYLVSAVLFLGLNYASTLLPGYRGSWEFPSWESLLAHCFYLNDILHLPWVNGVYWSLAVEFQYYLFMAIVFPFLPKNTVLQRGFIYAACLIVAAYSSPSVYFLAYLDLFATGFACYAYLSKRASLNETLIVILLTCTAGIFFQRTGYSVAACVAALIIIMPLRVGAFVVFFSDISYSMYLLHTPIGNRPLNFARRFEFNEWESYLVGLGAFGIIVFSAWIMYLLVEGRSMRFAKKIPY